ncbi:hypothetical protein LguiA_009537 [Lonicera macranthoides]
MGYDSIANVSIPATASNANDFAKKKRANRTAKLKQCKLDARREQWLSQVKNNSVKKHESNNAGVTRAPPRNVMERENLVINSQGEENDGSIHHDSDLESPSNSPISHTGSVLGGNDSETNFTGSSRSSSSSSSGRSSGGSSSDEECFDDWEAVADALAAKEHKQGQDDPNFQDQMNNNPASGLDISKNKPECVPNSQAWRPNDAFRPQTLPNLMKQHSFPMNSDRYYGRGATAWVRKNVISSCPSSCPICFEELDLTDSSFLPCPCGFRLCLFCHKRILEGDGRCPGCRKPYDYVPVEGEAALDGRSMTFQLARSCSMITRS